MINPGMEQIQIDALDNLKAAVAYCDYVNDFIIGIDNNSISKNKLNEYIYILKDYQKSEVHGLEGYIKGLQTLLETDFEEMRMVSPAPLPPQISNHLKTI